MVLRRNKTETGDEKTLRLAKSTRLRKKKESRYTKDWKEVSERIRFGRDNGICAHCNAKHGENGVYVQAAHKNHIFTDNRDENLITLCERCHLNFDRAENIRKRKERKARERAAQKIKVFARIERMQQRERQTG